MVMGSIIEKIKTFNVKEQTLENSINIINKIPVEFISMIELDDVYKTNYGTIIIEWDKDGNHFQLEIGKNEMGYFSEKNGKDLFLRENKTTIDSINLLVNDMKSVLY